MAYRVAGQFGPGASSFSSARLRPSRPSSAPTIPIRSRAETYLAIAYRDAGQLERVIPILEQTLAAGTLKLGLDHPKLLSRSSILASAYRDAGQLDRAIPLFERTLAAQTARLGSDHPDTLHRRNYLANAYRGCRPI